MKTFLDKLHAKLGDLWWYSILLFVACRSGDAIQAFIGLWLVPKYVGPEELGAVLPLQQLAGFFTIPLAVIATVFVKYVNAYATRGELGKVKSFILDVLFAAAVVFLLCIFAAYLLVPHFYSRLNVGAGSLTFLILAAGFAGNISNLFTGALQGLKKFRTMTVANLISAPIRLVTLLISMPFRPLSGYILGQTTPPGASSMLAAWSLHRDLKSVSTDKSWRKDIPAIFTYLWPIAIYMAVNALTGTVQMTVFRQRLPEIESSAYYLLSRFAEMAGYVSLSMTLVMFPIASEAHERGTENRALLNKTIIATAICTALLALGFHFTAPFILSLTSTWQGYAQWAHLLPILTLTTGLASICGAIVSYEMACRRFGAASILTICNALSAALIVVLTGYGYFQGMVSDAILTTVARLNLAEISHISYFCLAFAAIPTLILLPLSCRRNTPRNSTR